MPTGGIVTTYTDITEHKQSIEKLQQAKTDAEQAAAAKAAFLATMSHEIRTPMNGVIGMTSVLLDSRLTRDQREIVEVIRQSGESLLVVINDILDYSKIESGQMKLEWLPLRLEEVVDNCLRLLGPKAKEKGVILSVDMDRRIPSLILGDRTRLQQVLMNLLSNAVKFTQHGTVRVTLVEANSGSDHTASNETGDICEVSVAVEDSGIGIPQEKLTGIFEPFVQADSSTARRFGGTGLGLAIAKRLVEAMGGQISIESEVGRGTRACFSFLAEAAIPSGIATPISDAPLWQKKVLLIAGSRADVRVLMTALVRWGMEVDTCSGTSEGSSRLAGNERFDLVLAATHMTEARWQTFVQALRETGVGVPAILLSRTRKVTSVDNALGARILARSCTEATLYDALVDAMEFGGERPFSEFPERLQFDDSLGQAAPLRILVAEDNEINRKVVLRMLAGFGYQADVAQNGEQVIDLISQRSYDLVLMDVQMPKVDGIEATKFIVENIPAARRPRVVAMSANVMREEVDAALAAGADHYIAKPFAPSELRATLEESANRLSVAAAPTWRSAPQVLSLDRLRSHLAGDPTGAFLAELSADFSRVSAQLQCRLQEATDARDVQRLGSTVHEYLGVCAVVGAEKLMQLLLRLQKTIRAGTLKAAAVLVERSQSLQEQTVQELQAAASKHRERAAGIRSDGQVIPLSRDKKR
jgi:CheY-like chemotaxis protein/nitrogen-specific signal transduction histidine kinase